MAKKQRTGQGSQNERRIAIAHELMQFRDEHFPRCVEALDAHTANIIGAAALYMLRGGGGRASKKLEAVAFAYLEGVQPEERNPTLEGVMKGTLHKGRAVVPGARSEIETKKIPLPPLPDGSPGGTQIRSIAKPGTSGNAGGWITFLTETATTWLDHYPHFEQPGPPIANMMIEAARGTFLPASTHRTEIDAAKRRLAERLASKPTTDELVRWTLEVLGKPSQWIHDRVNSVRKARGRAVKRRQNASRKPKPRERL